jgi:sulfur-carrier protein adenylyltransferase/sulfurtransferase
MPKATVRIPTPLRALADGRREVPVEGLTVGALVQRVTEEYPGLRRQLYGPEGKLRSFVTLYLNDEDVRSLQRDETPVREGDVVSIVPAIAGGTGTPSVATPNLTGSIGSEGESPSFGRDDLLRYSRHILLPEVGLAGQKRLRDAKVLLVGAGGLGAPTSLYLAAAGVGRIGLVDFDAIELSNLQRQVLYTTADVGRPKLETAKRRLEALNPNVEVVPHGGRLTADQAMDVLRPYDIIVDGTDNFPTRYLVSDAAVLLGKPYVYGSIYRFEGQVSVFDAKRGPCYRCLYPEPPPPDMTPSCGEAGVLGVLPGLIGLLQATETVKLVLGIGEPLIGRLVLYDALALQFRELRLAKNPACVLCSPTATQKGLIDYPAFCGLPAAGTTPKVGVPEISPEELAAELRSAEPPLVIDVREPDEWSLGHLATARLIPKDELLEHVDELTSAREIVLYCRSGNRSGQSTRQLLELGFAHVKSLRGGINAWSEKVDPSIPKY